MINNRKAKQKKGKTVVKTAYNTLEYNNIY